MRTISGFQKPQGILVVPGVDKIFVASGDDGMVRVYSGKSFRLLDSINWTRGANRIAYDTRKKAYTSGMEERTRDKITAKLRLSCGHR